LVKSLHPIHEIANRVSQDNENLVRLIGGATNGDFEPVVDPTKATIAALNDPIEFPPLAAGIVPGDRVAIAVDESVPRIGEIVRGAIKALEQAGVEPEAISVVATDSATAQSCRDALSADEIGSIQFVVHDPDDDENLCFVGLTKKGQQLKVNRTVFDADLVLPIRCARLNGRGVYESLFPRFSNAETIGRYRTPAHIESFADQEARLRETEEAGWLIGVPMAVEVVPGGDDSVARILAGEPQAVAQASEAISRRRWALESPQQVSLMIATITGGPGSQNWTNVGRALATAERLVVEGGAVAICSNLSESLGPSLGRLVGNPDLDTAARKILHEREADSWPAWQLARALQRGPVYFLSQLDPETVEELGLAPVDSVDDLMRLAARSESFAVVEDSQNVVITLAGDANDR
jgi:nickel-dependent lactate racemase